MKTIILILALTAISFAQTKAKLDSVKANNDKDTIKTAINTKIETKSATVLGKSFSYKESAYPESWRMVYSDTLIALFKSEGFTATKYNLYIGKSVEECLKKLGEVKR